jgi:hypothetical protein
MSTGAHSIHKLMKDLNVGTDILMHFDFASGCQVERSDKKELAIFRIFPLLILLTLLNSQIIPVGFA